MGGASAITGGRRKENHNTGGNRTARVVALYVHYPNYEDDLPHRKLLNHSVKRSGIQPTRAKRNREMNLNHSDIAKRIGSAIVKCRQQSRPMQEQVAMLYIGKARSRFAHEIRPVYAQGGTPARTGSQGGMPYKQRRIITIPGIKLRRRRIENSTDSSAKRANAVSILFGTTIQSAIHP